MVFDRLLQFNKKGAEKYAVNKLQMRFNTRTGIHPYSFVYFHQNVTLVLPGKHLLTVL